MLNLAALKRIKPTDSKDDYLAGEDLKGNCKASTIEKGKAYRASIYDLLLSSGPLTTAAIAEALSISMGVVSSIIQKMFRKGTIKQGKKVDGAGVKKAFTYLVA